MTATDQLAIKSKLKWEYPNKTWPKAIPNQGFGDFPHDIRRPPSPVSSVSFSRYLNSLFKVRKIISTRVPSLSWRLVISQSNIRVNIHPTLTCNHSYSKPGASIQEILVKPNSKILLQDASTQNYKVSYPEYIHFLPKSSNILKRCPLNDPKRRPSGDMSGISSRHQHLWESCCFYFQATYSAVSSLLSTSAKI